MKIERNEMYEGGKLGSCGNNNLYVYVDDKLCLCWTGVPLFVCELRP